MLQSRATCFLSDIYVMQWEEGRKKQCDVRLRFEFLYFTASNTKTLMLWFKAAKLITKRKL